MTIKKLSDPYARLKLLETKKEVSQMTNLLKDKGISANGIVNVQNRINYLSGIVSRHIDNGDYFASCDKCKQAEKEMWQLLLSK